MTEKFLILGKSEISGKVFQIPAARSGTKKWGTVGISGSGKTHNVAVLVEQYIQVGICTVIWDPVGRWWDLGVGADGKGPGLPIAIIGGRHGQIELTQEMGASIAHYVAEYRVPTVVDLSQMRSKSHWRQVLADFGNELFEVNTRPLHLEIEEAPEFIPQRVVESIAGVYGAMDKLIRIGRNNGIGIGMIAQRPQMINKDALSQVNALLVMRLTDPGSIDTIKDWLEAQGADSDLTDRMIQKLPTLADGTGLVLSPAWLKTFDIVHFNRRETFHYDPEADEEEIEPTRDIARAVDTAQLEKIFSKFMGAKPQLVKSEKVSAARSKHVAELEQKMAELQTALEAQQESVITDEEVQQRVHLAVQEKTARIAQLESSLAAFAEQIKTILGGEVEPNPLLINGVASVNKVAALVKKSSPRLRTAERKVFETLGNLYPDFPAGVSSNQLAVEAGYALTGGAFIKALATLRKRQLIIRSGGMIRINQELLG